jgi:hypothetical protein
MASLLEDTVRAVKLETTLTDNRELTLTVPPEIPSGPIEVVILAKEQAAATLLEFLDELESSASSRTPAEIEADIAAERQAWDR